MQTLRLELADMKKRSGRLQKIVKLAAMEERKECIDMGRSQQELDQAVSRLGELTSYRRGYFSSPHVGESYSAVRWHDYQNFLLRLNQAVDAQEEFVLNGEQNVDAHRHRWMLKRQRLNSLEQVFERYKAAEESEIEKALQKTLDDLPMKPDIFEN